MARDEKGRFKAAIPQTGIIHGLPLTVSKEASDLLAAFHLGFSEALTFFREINRPGAPEQVLVHPEGGVEDGGLEENAAMPPGLSPLAAAAWRVAHGVPEPEYPGEENPEDHPAYKEMEEALRMQGIGDEGPEDKK